MDEIERNFYKCAHCGHVADYDYESDVSWSDGTGDYVGMLRSAEFQRVAAGHYIIFLVDSTTGTRTEGACIDTDKTADICHQWVSEGVVCSSFQSPKPYRMECQ